MFKATSKYRTEALAIGGDESRWFYNFRVLRRYTFLGIGFWRKMSMKTFTFPRYSNNPKVDGLSQYVAQQKHAHGF